MACGIATIHQSGRRDRRRDRSPALDATSGAASSVFLQGNADHCRVFPYARTPCRAFEMQVTFGSRK